MIDRKNPEPGASKKLRVSLWLAAVFGSNTQSKAAKRTDYDAYVKAIRDSATVKALTDWYERNTAGLNQLPSDWLDELRVEYSDRLADLKRALAV